MNPVSNSVYRNALKTIMTELFWWLGIIASQHLTKSRTQCQWRDYNQAKTTNYVKNNEARLDFARNHLKECTVLKIKSLDRWNKGTRVPGWWEKEKVWRDTTLCQTWWRQCYGMVVYGWWWNQIIGVNWWWYSLIIFSPMLLNWSDRSNLKVKKWYVLQWPDQSPDLKPTEHAFELLNTKLNVETPTQAVTECEGSLGL